MHVAARAVFRARTIFAASAVVAAVAARRAAIAVLGGVRVLLSMLCVLAAACASHRARVGRLTVAVMLVRSAAVALGRRCVSGRAVLPAGRRNQSDKGQHEQQHYEFDRFHCFIS
jgi:hypothetical protein